MTATDFSPFDHTLHETNRWLNEVSAEMNHPSRQMAYHALRGVLFALRDRLPPEEVLHLSAQLPMLVRGLFFEGYRWTGKPETFHADEFLVRVREALQQAGGGNAQKATRAVLTVLERHVSAGEMHQIRQRMPEDLRRLWPPLPVE